MNNQTVKYILVALCLPLGCVVGIFVHQQKSKVSYQVDIPAGQTVKVYRDIGGDAPFQYDATKPPLDNLARSQSITTKPGVYDFVLSNSQDYSAPVVKVTVNEGTKRVSVRPSYSDAKLNALLVEERDGVIDALRRSYGAKADLYVFSVIKLFERGNWAGVTLTPKSSQYDPVRLIFHKQGGVWSVATAPSILVIGSYNPSVPQAVIDQVNAL